MDPIERTELEDGTVVEIHYDDTPEHSNPRQYDNLGTMFVSYPGYGLGDEELGRDGFDEIDCPACDDGERPPLGPVHMREVVFGSGKLGITEVDPVCARCENYHRVEPTVDEWLAEQDAIAAMPLFVYEHSGITISAGRFVWVGEERFKRGDAASHDRFVGDSAGWDTSFVGFIITTRERCEELGVAIERDVIESGLGSEVEEYAKYLEGQVYGYVIEDPEGEHQDSCWGFLGFEYCKEEAGRAAKEVAESFANELRERGEWAARDTVTD